MQKKKSIMKGILVAVILIIGLVLYSEKVNKIAIIDNIKNVLSEQIQKAVNTITGAEDITEVDVTNLIMGQETQHEHLWKTMYDENKHWEECTACGEIGEKVEHSIIDSGWSMGNNCNELNVHSFNCSCGYNYETTLGRKAHDFVKSNNESCYIYTETCKSCRIESNSHKCQKNDGSKIGCFNLGTCSICRF